MPDYGHDLRFGSFVTPRHDPPHAPVELALLSEDLGLDLVTFQDHPYQAAFHDTWTLLTWVAARTSRIHVSGNVLNLPLRQPAVLARAVASLDLLSGGRAELGLGAGGFFDAIVSMGGPRLTAPDAVTGLDEALDVLRGLWDADDPRPLTAGGRFHRVEGAARGPAPAHDVPIWLGALKPRMLRLVGRKADGWLPSLPYLRPGDLARGNALIDEAARGAGRDPGDVVRLLNVTPRDSAEDLARLAIEDGVSTFIVLADDPRALRRFAEVTAPEVRERVGEAREAAGRGSGAGSVAPAAGAGADRPVPALAGDPVPESLAAHALTPGAPGYARYTTGYFRGGRPALVLRPQTPAEVQDAVRYAARHRDVPLGLRSGGHGLSGRSVNDGGIVLALDALSGVEVLAEASGAAPPEGGAGGRVRVRVGPGARWGEVAAALAPHGRALTAGDYGGVGVGGLATAGGIGWFVREHGLTIDHLRSVDVVTAAGDLVTASADEHPDLFWAMRGAGANFGVATSFVFDTHPVPERVGFATLVFAVEDVAAFLEAWGAAVEAAHPSVGATVMIGSGASGAAVAAQVLVLVDSDDPDVVLERLQPFTELAPLVQHQAQLVPYHALLAVPPGGETQHGRGEPHAHSGMIRAVTGEVARALAEVLRGDEQVLVALRSAGGAAGLVPADATAYAWRDAQFNVAVLGRGGPEAEARWARVVPLLEGVYLSFETDLGADVLERTFPPAHLARLRALKREWDPRMVFRDNFPIEPAGEAGGVR